VYEMTNCFESSCKLIILTVEDMYVSITRGLPVSRVGPLTPTRVTLPKSAIGSRYTNRPKFVLRFQISTISRHKYLESAIA